MVTRDDVLAAAARIEDWVRRTPVLETDDGTWFKLEYLQHGGSFKARGAFNRILAAQQAGELDPAVGIVVASGGNAGLGNAYAARAAGIPATVVVPENTPAVKADKLRRYGAGVILRGTEYAHAAEGAVEHAAATGAVLCHAYDQPEIVAGAGTVGLELLDQTGGELDTVLVAVGGGGLMAGVAAALEGRARVVAVEPETSRAVGAALEAGHPVDVAVSGIAIDSLGARRVGDIAFEVATRTGVVSRLVTDEAIAEARRRLWEEYRIAVEHGAAAAYAALTSGAYTPAPGERVAVVLCGANTNPADLA
ncbi:MAG: threonine/serine dehydratase [Nocardioidaceae bacterium]|nr:threonine/serine dehydratase [Nocardioidaceae bacterium]